MNTVNDRSRIQAASTQEMIDIKEAAMVCGISDRHFRRLVDTGRAPRGVMLGRCVRWSRSILHDWLLAGCPCLAAWNRQKGGDLS